ncbi:hypothetical protein DFH08DRAFT_167463 [Mycena albidolilacea]|uniref:Uncharacterized protein n=1 Tax=Mycena albidolilacea TaxID=1033008 RepID=A0AAD7F4G8_9AGAR|nr:hypothetical protein DFH08DRAFT_167463 [Mycena albidolilacea]
MHALDRPRQLHNIQPHRPLRNRLALLPLPLLPLVLRHPAAALVCVCRCRGLVRISRRRGSCSRCGLEVRVKEGFGAGVVRIRHDEQAVVERVRRERLVHGDDARVADCGPGLDRTEGGMVREAVVCAGMSEERSRHVGGEGEAEGRGGKARGRKECKRMGKGENASFRTGTQKKERKRTLNPPQTIRPPVH